MIRPSLGSLLAVSALLSGVIALPGRPATNEANLLTSRKESAATSSTGLGLPGCNVAPSADVTCDQFWLQNIKHEGVAPFAGAANYRVWRNVKDFGAKGDGATDDTKAINDAIAADGTCAPGKCTGSTKRPAVIYFPPGTYKVSSPIVLNYNTQLIGNPCKKPIIKAASNFVGAWVLDANQYQAGGSLGWQAVNVFWRQVANLAFELRDVPSAQSIYAVHWPSSQSTSLSNIEIFLKDGASTKHRGVFIEEGSGGYVGDIVITGGEYGLEVGNQQFTFRGITIRNAQTAIKHLWSWGWTYIGVTISGCQVGFDLSNTNADTGALEVKSITILDSEIINTGVGIKYASPSSAQYVANSLALERIRLENVPKAIVNGTGATVLPGTPARTMIENWGRGNRYTPSKGPIALQGSSPRVQRPRSLTVEPNGDYYTASKPYYMNAPVSAILTARGYGAKGDGKADDTNALNNLFDEAAKGNKIAYIDAGVYRVTSTVRIPAGSRIFGDPSFPQIVSSGSYFGSQADPKPVIQVGLPGSKGRIEWSNTIVSTKGRQPGAILIQYNLNTPTSSCQPSGMWDVHVRIGGFAGSDLELKDCAKTPEKTATANNIDKDCVSGFLSWHITPDSGGLYQENNWVWVADHDIEDGNNNAQITVYAGRGLLVESRNGPNWLVASSVEHHQRYQYQFYRTSDVFMGQIQTETAYYQPNPDATIPFPAQSKYHDPTFLKGQDGWGLRVVDSTDLIAYGAGLYSFFNNYNLTCSQENPASPRCQSSIFSVEGDSKIRVFNLNTVGSQWMATIGGKNIADYKTNRNGFVSTVADLDGSLIFGTSA